MRFVPSQSLQLSVQYLCHLPSVQVLASDNFAIHSIFCACVISVEAFISGGVIAAAVSVRDDCRDKRATVRGTDDDFRARITRVIGYVGVSVIIVASKDWGEEETEEGEHCP